MAKSKDNKPQCNRCKHHFILNEDERARVGANNNEVGCRRYPSQYVDRYTLWMWPIQRGESCCGEYEPLNPQSIDEGAKTIARHVLLGDMTAARALVDKILEVT